VLAPIVLTIYMASCMRKMSNKNEIILSCSCCLRVIARLMAIVGRPHNADGNEDNGLFGRNVKCGSRLS
jgi:hypothetical protein